MTRITQVLGTFTRIHRGKSTTEDKAPTIKFTMGTVSIGKCGNMPSVPVVEHLLLTLGGSTSVEAIHGRRNIVGRG